MVNNKLAVKFPINKYMKTLNKYMNICMNTFLQRFFQVKRGNKFLLLWKVNETLQNILIYPAESKRLKIY